jgi:hypothetical protein
MKIKEKKLANNINSIVKIDHQIYPLVPPPFEIFCPVLALTKVGSAGHAISQIEISSHWFFVFLKDYLIKHLDNFTIIEIRILYFFLLCFSSLCTF